MIQVHVSSPHILDLIQDFPNSYSVKLGSWAQFDISWPHVSHFMLILLTSPGYSIAIHFCTTDGRVLFPFTLENYIHSVSVKAHSMCYGSFYIKFLYIKLTCSPIVLHLFFSCNEWLLEITQVNTP